MRPEEDLKAIVTQLVRDIHGKKQTLLLHRNTCGDREDTHYQADTCISSRGNLNKRANTVSILDWRVRLAMIVGRIANGAWTRIRILEPFEVALDPCTGPLGCPYFSAYGLSLSRSDDNVRQNEECVVLLKGMTSVV